MQERTIPAPVRDAILAWYDAEGRPLAFRGTRDPYAILVSEVMAQQTQVARVQPAWRTFLDAFPTVARLADAPTADVLRAWRGLGYNRRALNLQRAARAMVAEHDGRVPSDVAALERLPGIGPYTARAVAAIAFGLAVGPVDTNVRRVLHRLLGFERLPPRRLQAIADAAVPAERPADWTHALMDLGATACRAIAPRCDACPVRAWCASAGAVPGRRAAAARARAPFTSSARWLRGRIVDRLRDAPDGEWTAVAGPIGSHDGAAVASALMAMESEGLLERQPADPARARLPLSRASAAGTSRSRTPAADRGPAQAP
jgi:A/G-specific adenine glycosylase